MAAKVQKEHVGKKEFEARFCFAGIGQWLVRNVTRTTVDHAPSWKANYLAKCGKKDQAILCSIVACNEAGTLGGHVHEFGHTVKQGRNFHFLVPLCELHNNSSNHAWMKTKPDTEIICMLANAKVSEASPPTYKPLSYLSTPKPPVASAVDVQPEKPPVAPVLALFLILPRRKSLRHLEPQQRNSPRSSWQRFTRSFCRLRSPGG